MNFFWSIINTLRNIRASVTTFFHPRRQVVGSIVSGNYSNYKTDPTPTILYMGTYQNPRNGKYYTHGINLHYLDSAELSWLLKLILLMKRGGQVIVPRDFYYYLKLNQPSIIRKSYRTYHAEMTNFYTISPGFSNASVSSCYSVKDPRDQQIVNLNQAISQSYNINQNDYTNPARIAYNQNELQEHITEVLNSRRII